MLLQALVILGGLALIGPLLSALSQSEDTIGQFLAGGLLVVLLWFAARLLIRAVAFRRLSSAVSAATAKHIDALVRRRAQLVTPDAYGTMQVDRWEKEIKHFIQTKIAPGLSERQSRSLLRRQRGFVGWIGTRVSAVAAASPLIQSLSINVTPTEFEVFCADELRRSGWNAHVTKASRDQGVDVIAQKAGIRVILQCKLYSRPVGNKAVQEAAAGRAHERAHYAAVVSKTAYTSAAEQLAQTNGVLLLHYSQLCKLDELIAVPPAGVG